MAGAAKGETAGNELNKALGPFGGALPDIERAPDGCYGKKKSKRRRRWRIELGSSGARGNTGRRQTMPDTSSSLPTTISLRYTQYSVLHGRPLER